MSNNISTSVNNNPNNYITRDEFETRRLLDYKVAWYNPSKKRERIDGKIIEPETIYLGGNEKPTWEVPVMDVATHREHVSLIRQGKIDSDKLKFGAYYPEWEDLANEHADRKEMGNAAYNQFRSANVGIITSSDSPALNVVQVLGELQGQDTRNYTLEGALTRVATPNLEISVDSIYGFTASQDVGELQEPDVKKGKFARTKYTLKKDAGYIMQSDESQFTNERDVFNIGIAQVTRDLTRILNGKIAARLEASDITVTSGGADWLAITGEHRTNSAIAQLEAAINDIDDNGGVADTIASDPKVFRAYNSNVSGGATLLGGQPAGSTGVVGNNVNTNIPGINGFTWYTDRLLTDTRVTIFDKRAVLLMQGPVRTAQFRDDRRGADGYITRNWRGIAVIDTSRIRALTSVA